MQRALAFAFLLVVAPARADDPVAVAELWGLIGTWKVDCALPASQDNMAETYRVEAGQLFERRDFGTWQDTNPVRSAYVDHSGALVLTIEFPGVGGQIRENVLVKSQSGKRTVENHLADQTGETVRDGRLTSSGQPTPWFQRCEDGRV